MFISTVIFLSVMMIFSSFPEMMMFANVLFIIFMFLFLTPCLSGGYNLDEMVVTLMMLTLLICSFCLISSSCSGWGMAKMISLSSVILLFFFSTDSVFFFFIFFEMSLFPLFFLILSWGRQAERILATQFMMLYTIIASAPLLFVLILKSLMSNPSFFILSIWEDSSSVLDSISVLAFLVKIPVFFFHSWLPKAHVEAPLEGSMLLAGVMLKVGLYGLIRMIFVSDGVENLKSFLLPLSLLGALSSSVLALSSDDMKMSVAFSSVSHMNAVVSALLSMKSLGLFSTILVMIAHGICSPMLFFLVTKIYLLSSSRSSLLSKGVMSKFPLLSFFGVILWILNMSTPPFYSFIGELTTFSSIFSFTPLIGGVWVVMFLFFSSFYCMMNYGVQFHSSSKSVVKSGEYDFLFFMMSIIVVGLSILFFMFQPL